MAIPLTLPDQVLFSIDFHMTRDVSSTHPRGLTKPNESIFEYITNQSVVVFRL